MRLQKRQGSGFSKSCAKCKCQLAVRRVNIFKFLFVLIQAVPFVGIKCVKLMRKNAKFSVLRDILA